MFFTFTQYFFLAQTVKRINFLRKITPLLYIIFAGVDTGANVRGSPQLKALRLITDFLLV